MKITVQVPDWVGPCLEGEGELDWTVLAIKLAPSVKKRAGDGYNEHQGLTPAQWVDHTRLAPVRSFEIVEPDPPSSVEKSHACRPKWKPEQVARKQVRPCPECGALYLSAHIAGFTGSIRVWKRIG